MAKKEQTVSSEETTSQQLFSHLFEACNILRYTAFTCILGSGTASHI